MFLRIRKIKTVKNNTMNDVNGSIRAFIIMAVMLPGTTSSSVGVI